MEAPDSSSALGMEFSSLGGKGSLDCPAKASPLCHILFLAGGRESRGISPRIAALTCPSQEGEALAFGEESWHLPRENTRHPYPPMSTQCVTVDLPT